MKDIFMRYGRMSLVVRPALRSHVRRSKNKNKLINDLLAKHYKKPLEATRKADNE